VYSSSKNSVDLIGCMYVIFKNMGIYVQVRTKYLTHVKNNNLDFGLLLRNISETNMAMMIEIGGEIRRPFQDD